MAINNMTNMFITSKANISADGRRGQQTTTTKRNSRKLSLQQVEENNAFRNGWTHSSHLVCNSHSKTIGVIP